MSHDLGPQQRRVVRWAGRFRGAPVAFIAEDLGVTERRARKVIESLVDRELVVVVNDPWTSQRRVWTPDAHRKWERAQRRADASREQAKLYAPVRTAQSRTPAR